MTPSSGTLPVRVLDRALRLTRLILLIATPIVLVLTILMVIGVASLQLAEQRMRCDQFNSSPASTRSTPTAASELTWHRPPCSNPKTER